MKTLAISIVMCFATLGGLQAQKGTIISSLQNYYLEQLQTDMESFKAGDFSSTLNLDSTTIGKLFANSFIEDFQNVCSTQKGRISKEMIKSLKVSFKKRGKSNKMNWKVRYAYVKVFSKFAKLITDSGISESDANNLLKWYVKQESTEITKVMTALKKQYKKDLKTLLTLK